MVGVYFPHKDSEVSCLFEIFEDNCWWSRARKPSKIKKKTLEH